MDVNRGGGPNQGSSELLVQDAERPSDQPIAVIGVRAVTRRRIWFLLTFTALPQKHNRSAIELEQTITARHLYELWLS
jgi:hypothetical protein